MISVVVNTALLKARFQEFARTTKAKDIPRLLKVSARRVTYRAMELTPPTQGAGALGSWAEQLAQGQKAVDRDLKKLFFILKKEGQTIARQAVKSAKKNSTANGFVPLFSMPGGLVFAAATERFHPNATHAQMAEWHRKHQSKRGRALTPKNTRNGKVTILGKMVVGPAAFNRYRKVAIGALGFAKAGWGAAWAAYGGRMIRAGKSAPPPPSWVRRHFGKSYGTKSANLTGDRQFIEVVNSVNYIPAKERARIRSGAAQYEAATLARQTKEYLARKLARKTLPPIE